MEENLRGLLKKKESFTTEEEYRESNAMSYSIFKDVYDNPEILITPKEDKKEESFSEIQRVAYNRMNRQVLIDQMIDLSVNLKGEIKEMIEELYLDLGLKRDSLESFLKHL